MAGSEAGQQVSARRGCSDRGDSLAGGALGIVATSPLHRRANDFFRTLSKSRWAGRHFHSGAWCVAQPHPALELKMKYLLMIYSSESEEAKASEADNAALMAAYGAYYEAMTQAGVMVGGERLRPTAMATSVRVKAGKTEVLNGPYADTREQLGGYFVIDAPDLDAALHWAARCPSASHGTIEVRPIWAM
jgi:hypothetical protein